MTIPGVRRRACAVVTVAVACAAATPAWCAPFIGAGGSSFGLFRAQTASMDSATVRYLGSQWSYRLLKPSSAVGWQADADAAVLGTCTLGVEMAFTLTTAADESTNAYVPADMTAWLDSVTSVVERYDGDGDRDMPGLPCAVTRWHLEQEDTFWKSSDSEYLDFFAQTRAAILAADPRAQVGLIGFSGDQCWNAAYQAGFVHGPPPSIRYIAPQRLSAWYSRTQLYLSQATYDFVDLHSYQIQQTLQGELAFLRSLMRDPTVPVWCFEAGGPCMSRAEGYTDTLNAYHVMADYAEALANGVVGYAFEYLPPSGRNPDQSEKWTNVAMVSSSHTSTALTPKPSYETYRLLTQKLAGFTSAVDASVRDCVDEDSCLFDMRFETPRGPVDIVWCPRQQRTLTLETSAPRVVITHPVVAAGLKAGDAVVETRDASDGVVSILAGPEPVFVENGTASISEVAGGLGGVGAPRRVRLEAYPSPARSAVRLRARGLSAMLQVTLADVRGRLVRHLTVRTDGETDTGVTLWDLRDATGRRVPAGIYVARAADSVVRIPVLP